MNGGMMDLLGVASKVMPHRIRNARYTGIRVQVMQVDMHLAPSVSNFHWL